MSEPHTPEALQLALSKAKIGLMARPDSAFFTHLVFSLPTLWDDKRTPTGCTDGRKIWLNPDFFMGLTPGARIGLLLHEALHVAYMHVPRMGGRHARRWNHAADYVINEQILSRGFELPAGRLHDPKFVGMHVEEVYEIIPTPPDDPNNSQGLSDLQPEGELSPEEQDALTRDIEDILVSAAMQAKMSGAPPGSIPADIEIFLNKLLNPKLPWHVIMRKFFSSLAKNNYSFRKPNRRFFPQHVLPSLYSEKVCNFAAAVDTSGSVSDEQFLRIASEIYNGVRVLQPEETTLLQFDTRVHSINKVRTTAEFSRVKFKGRGGTDISDVYGWAEENKPTVLLIFSDGYFDWPSRKKPECPVIWLIHDNPGFKAPYGTVIHYEP